jgi:hypothetical protein
MTLRATRMAFGAAVDETLARRAVFWRFAPHTS